MIQERILATVDIGYAALCVSILRGVCIEEAFDRVSRDTEVQQPQMKRREDQDRDDLKIVRLKRRGKTWEQIGQIFGIEANTAYRRAKRYKERKGQHNEG